MKGLPEDKESINLLWTGGWDSTFQLLQLLVIFKSCVVPYYLIDVGRCSTALEILTIKRIKDRILKEYPYARELLKPTQYFAVADVASDFEIAEAYQSILKEKHIGSQYDWLARFCKEKHISDMQLCIHPRSRDKEHFNIESILSERTCGSQSVFHVDPKFEMMNEYKLFRYFSFPILKLTKKQMSVMANEQGWKEIMAMTWFCYNPTRNIEPCGRCNPCIQVIEDGLGWRIPLKSRIFSFFYKPLVRPLKPGVKLVLNKIGMLKYFSRSG
ncbi:7-cyano-7-deazaguanine synthase [Desulfocastanea catecholica]